jgi:NAD(P)-dependent dehydrogenase (short-subunit alcohol dehydrogenase family)
MVSALLDERFYVTMDLGLRGKSVLVTGGSKGIGFACARSFVAEGCRVHLAARDGARLEQARAELKGEVAIHACDLRDAQALQALAAACAQVDILVNNAGDIPGGTLESVDETKWRHAWELKVFGYVNLTRALFAGMRQRKSGVIVNVIGMAGENPSFEYICGSTANAGLAAFTKALGKGSVEHGVRVLGVHPPSTRTDRILGVMKAAAKAKFGDESRYPELAASGTFGRMIEPEQVGDTVAFLASARAGQLSGVVLNLGS